MTLRKSKPEPLISCPEVDYPRLDEFIYERRCFLRQFFLGTLSAGLGAGFAGGCAKSHSKRDTEQNAGNGGTSDPYPYDPENPDGAVPYPLNPDSDYQPPMTSGAMVEPDYPEPPEPQPYDAAVTIPPEPTPDASVAKDAGAPIDPDEEDAGWQIAGDIATPEYHMVNLPSNGNDYTILGVDEELYYSVTFITYDESLAEYFRQTESDALILIRNALSTTNCGKLDLGEMEPQIKLLLEAHYEEQSGRKGVMIESLTLLVDSCFAMPLAGGMPEPQY